VITRKKKEVYLAKRGEKGIGKVQKWTGGQRSAVRGHLAENSFSTTRKDPGWGGVGRPPQKEDVLGLGNKVAAFGSQCEKVCKPKFEQGALRKM